MGRFLITGPVHVRMSARIKSFPEDSSDTLYSPFGVATTVAGTGFHLSKAMTQLGDEVRFASFVGKDSLARVVLDELDAEGISSHFVLQHLDQTLQSIVVSDGNGLTHETIDLKGIQHRDYPKEILSEAVEGCSHVLLCETGLSRHFVEAARQLELDLALYLEGSSQGIRDPHQYPLSVVDILFASYRDLPMSPEQWVRGFRNREGPEIVVVSLGSKGAMIWVRADNFIERLAATSGDRSPSTRNLEMILFALFVHGLNECGSPYEALERALNVMSIEPGDGARAATLDDIDQKIA